MDDKARIVELTAQRDELLAACEAASKLCHCRGKGVYTKSCSMCGDSTFDHVCDDDEVPCKDPRCAAVRAIIAKATKS